MASYGALVRKITTAEINRVLREGGYTRWAYFVDEEAVKVGVLYANDTTFAASTVADEPDPKLRQYGLEAIKDLQWTPDPHLLVIAAGGPDNTLQAKVFGDPLMVYEDEFVPDFSYDTVQEWQRFLHDRGMRLPGGRQAGRKGKAVVVAIAVVAVLFLLLAFV